MILNLFIIQSIISDDAVILLFDVNVYLTDMLLEFGPFRY